MDSWSGDGYSLGWGEREIQLERKSEKIFQLWIRFFYEISQRPNNLEFAYIFAILTFLKFILFLLCFAIGSISVTREHQHLNIFDDSICITSLHIFTYLYGGMRYFCNFNSYMNFLTILFVTTWYLWLEDLNKLQLTYMNSLEMFGS